MSETVSLVLRLVLIGALYLFLIQLLWSLRQAARAAPASLPREAALIVLEAGASAFAPGEPIPLRPDTTVGRGAEADLVIPDQTVSGRHARLFRVGGEWWLEDLGSTNGTRLNGRPVGDAVAVDDQDAIDFGRVRFRIEWRD